MQPSGTATPVHVRDSEALREQLAGQLAVAKDATTKLAARLAAARTHARLATAAEVSAAEAAEFAAAKVTRESQRDTEGAAHHAVEAAVAMRLAADEDEAHARADAEQAHALLTAAKEVRELSEAAASASEDAPGTRSSGCTQDTAAATVCADETQPSLGLHLPQISAQDRVEQIVLEAQQARDKLTSWSAEMAASRQAKKQLVTAVQAATIKCVAIPGNFWLNGL